MIGNLWSAWLEFHSELVGICVRRSMMLAAFVMIQLVGSAFLECSADALRTHTKELA